VGSLLIYKLKGYYYDCKMWFTKLEAKSEYVVKYFGNKTATERANGFGYSNFQIFKIQ
jgi:hypothetical protein